MKKPSKSNKEAANLVIKYEADLSVIGRQLITQMADVIYRPRPLTTSEKLHKHKHSANSSMNAHQPVDRNESIKIFLQQIKSYNNPNEALVK